MKNIRLHNLICITVIFALFGAMPLIAETELFKLEAVASYYGAEFHGRPTSSGEIFDMNAFTAAHKTLPFGTMLEVTNLENGKMVVVRVNDRGPFVADRELDVSRAAALELGMITTGTARVSIRKIINYDGAGNGAPVSPAPVTSDTPVGPTTATTTDTPAAANPVTATPVKPVATVSSAPDKTGKPAEASQSSAGITGQASLWRIQLGSFSIEENATRLVIRLRKDGFNPAFERTETMIRVVLAGIPDRDLSGFREKLDKAGYGEYIVRQEAR